MRRAILLLNWNKLLTFHCEIIPFPRYQEILGTDDFDVRPPWETDDPTLDLTTGIANHIFDYDSDTLTGNTFIVAKKDYYLPVWQTSPVGKRSTANKDNTHLSRKATAAIDSGMVEINGMRSSHAGYSNDENAITSEMAWLLSVSNKNRTKYEGDIFTDVYFPVYDTFHGNR